MGVSTGKNEEYPHVAGNQTDLPIHVTRTFLPPRNEFNALLDRIWGSNYLTNNGPLLLQLEEELKVLLGLPHLLVVGNGTIALQLAIQALDLHGEVITTPYSYVASTTALIWEKCTPVFADINPNDFCLDPDGIEKLITPRTTAILATHVYGLPCAVERIEAIAKKHGLKVIYDGAHAFGTTVNDQSIFRYGDVATCSLHATKLFHSAEGGLVVCNDAKVHEKVKLMRSFGHVKDDHFLPGINGKNSELHAAMGLAVLAHWNAIVKARREQWWHYRTTLGGIEAMELLSPSDPDSYNHAYFPIVLRDEQTLLAVFGQLEAQGINLRRYFYPSLDKLPYIEPGSQCPISNSIAKRVLCLPLFHDMRIEEQCAIEGALIKAIEQVGGSS